MLTIEQYVNIIHISIVAVVFCEILIQPGMLIYWYDDLIYKLPKWLYNPLGGCTTCFAGQLSLWTYVLVYLEPQSLASWVGLILFSCSVMLLVTIFLKLLK